MNTVIQMKRSNQKAASTGRQTRNKSSEETFAPETETALKRAAAKLVALNQHSTDHAFKVGACFAEVKALVPEKAFGKWLKVFSDYSVRSAWNYVSIHERLQAYRAQLIASAVLPTVMFELARGEPPQIEAAVARLQAGERLKVKDVREMLGTKPKKKQSSEDAILNTGGLAGLQKVAEVKIAEDAARFHQILSAVLERVLKAMEPLKAGRAVTKKGLQERIVHDCRHAHDLINSIAAPLKPNTMLSMNWRPALLPTGTAWRKVQALLLQMGGVDNWPERTDFVPWLQNDVVPLLRFAVHGEALVSDDEPVSEVGVSDTPGAEDDLVAFEDMPASVQKTIEKSLESVRPESLDDVKKAIVFDPRPLKRHVA